jgi:hypothetical protein
MYSFPHNYIFALKINFHFSSFVRVKLDYLFLLNKVNMSTSLQSIDSVIKNLNNTTNDINTLVHNTERIISVLPIFFGIFIGCNVIIIVLLSIIASKKTKQKTDE